MNKNIQSIICVTISMLVLSGCGGDGKSEPKTIDTPNVNKVEKCSANKMTSLKKDDKVTALDNDTQIRITHTQSGEREACVESGDAKVN